MLRRLLAFVSWRTSSGAGIPELHFRFSWEPRKSNLRKQVAAWATQEDWKSGDRRFRFHSKRSLEDVVCHRQPASLIPADSWASRLRRAGSPAIGIPAGRRGDSPAGWFAQANRRARESPARFLLELGHGRVCECARRGTPGVRPVRFEWERVSPSGWEDLLAGGSSHRPA